MREISLHILDIAQNSLAAGATEVEISIDLDEKSSRLTVKIKDNGRGMDAEMLKRVADPFVTTRKERKVGLGIPLFRESALRTGGSFEIASEPGRGTTVTAAYDISNIDFPPMGDLAATVQQLIYANPDAEFVFRYARGDKKFEFMTSQAKDILGPSVPLNTPEVAIWTGEYLSEGIKQVYGGVL